MEYTAAQLRLIQEAEWGWASRGEDPPPPKPKPQKRKMTRAERNKRHREKRDTYLRAQISDSWVDDLLNRQRRASGKPEQKRKETPESGAPTKIVKPDEESEYTAEAWPWTDTGRQDLDDIVEWPLSDDWD